jgi:hypothetical protein
VWVKPRTQNEQVYIGVISVYFQYNCVYYCDTYSARRTSRLDYTTCDIGHRITTYIHTTYIHTYLHTYDIQHAASMLYAVCCVLYAVCCMLYAVCCVLYAVCCVLYAVCCMLCAVCCMLYAVSYNCVRNPLPLCLYAYMSVCYNYPHTHTHTHIHTHIHTHTHTDAEPPQRYLLLLRRDCVGYPALQPGMYVCYVY